MLVFAQFFVGHADVFRDTETTLRHSDAIAIHAETFDSRNVPLSVEFEDRQEVQKEIIIVRSVEPHIAVGVVDVDDPVVISGFFGSIEIGEGGHFVSRGEIIVAASGSRVLFEVVLIDHRTILIDCVGVEPFPSVTDDVLIYLLLYLVCEFCLLLLRESYCVLSSRNTFFVDDESARGRFDDEDGFFLVVEVTGGE